MAYKDLKKMFSLSINRTIVRAKKVEVDSIDKFREQAKSYVKVNEFDKSFPPLHLVENGITKSLLEYLKIENPNKALVGYSYTKHLELFSFTENLHSKLKIEKHNDHNNTVLFFNVKEKVIFYFRVCPNTSCDVMMKELQRCNDFLKAFLLLHEETLKSNECFSICSIIVLPTLNKKDIFKTLFFSEYPKILVLSKEDLQDSSSQRLNGVYKAVKEERLARIKKSNKKLSHKTLNSILSECMATMALVHTESLEGHLDLVSH